MHGHEIPTYADATFVLPASDLVVNLSTSCLLRLNRGECACLLHFDGIAIVGRLFREEPADLRYYESSEVHPSAYNFIVKCVLERTTMGVSVHLSVSPGSHNIN